MMTLRPDQEDGTNFLIEAAEEEGGAVLADEMGLGKSPQAITAVERMGCKRILIVCPDIAKQTWKEHLKEWLPGRRSVYIIETEQPFDTKEQALQTASLNYTIINYDMLTVRTVYETVDGKRIPKSTNRRHLDTVAEQNWDAIIIDEAHRARNRKSKTFLALKHVRQHNKTAALFALTGTPIYTHPDELWSLLHLVNMKKWSSYWKFVELYCTTKDSFFSKYGTPDGIANPEHLREVLKTILIRRLKVDIRGTEGKIFHNIPIKLDNRQRRMYDQMEEFMFTEYDGRDIEGTTVLTQILRLRQICISPELLGDKPILTGGKIDAVFDLLEDMEGQKVCIFSQYETLVTRLHNMMLHKKINAVKYTGKMHPTERRKTLESIVDPSGATVFLGTIQSCGVAINELAVCDSAIFVDVMWSPPDNAQAADRLDRMNRKLGPANIYMLTVMNSVEDDVLSTLQRKEDIFNATIPVTRIGDVLEKSRRRTA